MSDDAPHTTPADPSGALRRAMGVPGATMMGLGSIVGTGIFVSVGIATGIAGPSVILAIMLAGALAVCNALSSAQLAASHPTSGGTYEYGHVYLRPWLGFSAGWLFLCAKSASAATAALGMAGYTLALAGVPGTAWRTSLAMLAVVILVLVVLGGVRRSSGINIAIVSVTLGALAYFIVSGLPAAVRHGADHFSPFFESPSGDGRPAAARVLEAAALMFVAYTGYGRIATMGEEVRSPERTIPRAVIITLVASMALYIGVGAVGIGAAGAQVFGGQGTVLAAPLTAAARSFDAPGAGLVLSIGAATAMLGVLLNLVLGLSRVVLAMGRRGDLPSGLARVNPRRATPARAVLLVGAVILGLTAVGSITLAWSFSAFTVLVYYAITNLAAIRMPADRRRFHPAIAWAGLAGCLGLAFWVEPRAWIAGVGTLAAGLTLRSVARRIGRVGR